MTYMIYEIRTNKLVAYTESKSNLSSFLKIKTEDGNPKYSYHKVKEQEVCINYWEHLYNNGVIEKSK